MLKNKTLHALAATRLSVTGKPVDLALFAALDKELQKPDLQPTDAELVELSDMLDLTYEGGKNGYQEEGDISDLVALFARAVLCKYGQHRPRQPLSEADLTRIDRSIDPLLPIEQGKRVFARAIEAAHDIVATPPPPADANPPA